MAGLCERQELALLIAHNHPAGFDTFSSIDDQNERKLFPYALDKLGGGAITGSLLLRADRSLIGRVWVDEPLRSEPLAQIAVVGGAWHYENAGSPGQPTLHRQALALGDAFNAVVGSLRVGVVGCGATGSATAMLLARLGVGKVLLLDADIVDVTNLNRLHGATQSDADAAREKAATLRDAIAALGLGCKVRATSRFVEDPEARDAIRSCDIIFSCTDDHLGRAVLNRVAYFYLIPVIDVGLSLRPRKDSQPGFAHAEGRVTVLQPGTTCLLCREVLSPRKMHGDAVRRADPESYERLKAEGYIVGGGDPSPAVITFTTEIASMGVTEMIQRLTKFRGSNGHADQRYRYFLESEDGTSAEPPRGECRICGRPDSWGHGDCDPFLDMTL
jgi:molybdopterin/thiamine biosynthesis adenylyltransferase